MCTTLNLCLKWLADQKSLEQAESKIDPSVLMKLRTFCTEIEFDVMQFFCQENKTAFEVILCANSTGWP